MPYKNIAVIGAGGIGGPIAKALVSEGGTVVVVTRPGSSSAKSLPAGVKVISVGLTDVPALAAAFREHNIEVVVSTIAHEGLPNQKLLGDAAKQAGVKLFLPSEFGYSTIGQTEGELGLKAEFGEYLKEIDLPFARIFNGGFITYIPWLTSVDSGKIIISGGKGDTKASFTDPADIAGFTAYIITHLSPAELSNKIFRIEGERASMLDIAGYYGPKVPIEYVDGFDDGFKTFLHVVVNTGKGSTAYDIASEKELTGSDAAGASNTLWPGHHWKGIKEVLGL